MESATALLGSHVPATSSKGVIKDASRHRGRHCAERPQPFRPLIVLMG